MSAFTRYRAAVPDADAHASQTVTVKAGHGFAWWHATHLLITLLTLRYLAGLWVVVWAGHAIYSAHSRPSVTLEVPEGSRIEYYRGWPHVLADDEELPRDTQRIWMRRVAIGSVSLFAAALATLLIITRMR